MWSGIIYIMLLIFLYVNGMKINVVNIFEFRGLLFIGFINIYFFVIFRKWNNYVNCKLLCKY